MLDVLLLNDVVQEVITRSHTLFTVCISLILKEKKDGAFYQYKHTVPDSKCFCMRAFVLKNSEL